MSDAPSDLFVPIEQSALWRRHAAYWAERGAEALCWGEVPSLATTNWLTARAHARFYIALVAELEAAGALDDAGPVQVLELGAGEGRFAAYFLRALEEGGSEGRALLGRTRYLLSEGAQANLDQALSSPRLSPWVARGRLVGLRYDLTGPPPPLPEGPLVLVVAGYVASVLPAVHLQYHGEGGWRRLMVSEGGEGGSSPSAHRWTPAVLELALGDPRHAEVARRATLGLDAATLIYPTRYLDLARDLAPQLAPGGVLVTRDCGEADDQAFVGHYTRELRRYGGSVAECVQFRLFHHFAEVFGWQAALSDEPLSELPTALLSPDPLPLSLRRAFDEHLAGDEVTRLMDERAGAARALDAGEPLRALRGYLRCAEIDPYDPEYRYRIGVAALELGRPRFAQSHLLVGWEEDIEARWDIAFELGRAHALLGEPEGALAWYERSQIQSPHPITESNIAALRQSLASGEGGEP